MVRWLVFFVCFVASTIYAEYRIWTNTNGYSIEAEFLAAKGDQLALKKRDGTIIKTTISSLCEDDQEFIRNKVPAAKVENGSDADAGVTSSAGGEPPRLKINVKTGKRTSKGTDYDDRLIEFQCVVTITRISSTSYSGKMKATLFVIGKNVNEDTYKILDVASSTFKMATSAEREHTFSGKPVKSEFDKNLYSTFGYEYEGYVVIVQDEKGGLITADSNRKSFEQNAESFLKLRINSFFNNKLKEVDEPKK